MTLFKVFAMFLLSAGFVLSGCGEKDSELPVSVTVQPNFFKVPAGGEVQFSAEVSGTLKKGVTWRLNSGPGTIHSETGLYRSSPSDADVGKTAAIQATSVDDPNAFGNAAVSTTPFSKVLRGVADGTSELFVGGFTVRAGQTIDINGDNNLDLISMNPSSHSATVFFGLGDGRFLKKVDVTINQPVTLAVGDFINDEDFVADVAIASETDTNVRIVSGKKIQKSVQEDVFPGVVVATLDLTGAIPTSLAVGGFHGDPEARNADLVVGTADKFIILFLQDRQGLPGAFSPPLPPISVGGRPIQMVTGDLNQDSLLDLAVLREGMADILILLGDGNGNFSPKASAPFSSPPTSLALGGFNKDSIPDLAATHADRISVSLGKGDGTFLDPLYHPVISKPESINVADFNLGGEMDIAVALSTSNTVLFLFGDGTGRFIGQMQYNTGAAPLSLISGFFTQFQTGTGFQTIDLLYINGLERKFYTLTNRSQ